MWFNSLVASAGGSDRRPERQRQGRTTPPSAPPRSCRALANEAAPAGPGDQQGGPGAARLRVRALGLRGQLLVRLPERRRGEGKAFQKKIGWARYPRTEPDKPSRPPLGGINLGVGAYSKHPDLAFDAAQLPRAAREPGRSPPRRAACRPPPRRSTTTRRSRRRSRSPTCCASRSSSGAPRPVTPAYSDISLAIQKTFHPPDRHRPGRRSQTSSRTASTRRPKGRSSDGGGQRPSHRAPEPQPRERKQLTERARAERRLAWMLCAPAVIVMLVVTGYPIVYAIYLSLQTLRPALPRRQGVRRPLQLRRRAHLEHVVVGRRQHADHHRRLGGDRARARHGDRAGHAPRDLRPRPGARGDPDPVRDRHRGRRVRLALRLRPGQRLRPGPAARSPTPRRRSPSAAARSS